MPAPAPSTSTTAVPAAAPALALVPPVRPTGLRARLQGEDAEAGMSTAEYAIGTVAACGFGGVLYKVIMSDTVFGLLKTVISKAFELVF